MSGNAHDLLIASMKAGATKRDYPEEFHHDNGCYQNKCIDCEKMFFGGKYRRLCKVCDFNRKNNPRKSARKDDE
jgi:hypothetical protein